MGLFLSGDNRAGVFYDAELAEKLGVNAAIILSRIIWSIEKHIEHDKKEGFFRDGRWWMYDSIPALIAYSKLGRKQILLVLKTLRDSDIIQSRQFDQSSGRNQNYYTVDNDRLKKVLGGLVPKRDEGVSAETVSTPLVPKGDEGQCRKGTKVSAETALTSVPKGDYLSKSLTKSQTESLTKSPATVTPLPIKPRPKKEKSFKYDPEDLELAKPWLEFSLKESSYAKPPKNWIPEGFADGIRQVRASTEFQGKPLNHFGMKAVFQFILTSKFWRRVAWSPEGLLKKNEDGVRKIDNILRQMKPESFRQEEKIRSWAPVTEQEINNPFG
jgi:hypothetical protein